MTRLLIHYSYSVHVEQGDQADYTVSFMFNQERFNTWTILFKLNFKNL